MSFELWSRWARRCASATAVAVLVACGGGGGGTESTEPTAPGGGESNATAYRITGTVVGLDHGKSVVLNNGTTPLTVSAGGTFTVLDAAADGSSYQVSVATQPEGQFCNVGNGTGRVQAAHVTSIRVACAELLSGGNGTLHAAGGTVSTDAVDVSAPAGASVDTQEVTVSTVSPPAGLPSALMPIGAAVDVAVSKPHLLNAPLLLTVRYDPRAVTHADDLSVVHYNSAAQRYEPVTVLAHDRASHAITFEARTFSPFVVVDFAAAELPTSYTVPGFDPSENGWSIPNFGSYHSPGGNCLGMSGYSTWYFGSRSGPLATKFSPAGSPSTAQLVAARAHLAQSQYWARQSDDYLRRLGNGATARLMRMSLALFGQPTILLLGTDGTPRHASVLFGYDANGFKFYDVNVPGQTQTVRFDGTNWGTYSRYNTFSYVALPSLGRTEDFEQLTAQAEGGFASSSLITVTAPTPGQGVDSHSVTLTGTLSGELNGASSMVAYVKGVPQRVAAGTGAFESTLPVSAGDNTIVLFAGPNISQQSNWYPNAATMILSVNGTAPPTTLLTTLTWDQDASDVDLYVIEPPPRGEAAWYANMVTDHRMALDFDNTVGFGPEHVTLTTTGAQPGTVLDGLYKVRVHYYGDHGAGSTVSGTVSILINEGQPTQRLVQRRFTLSGADPRNDRPSGSGGDWADIASVDLINGVVH